ncbi:unannotated protein [freshwater metagenome]|uniref:Unannotated protein n=1 Tax=freshwater metagenome TaxID=449393 RepID=A0A6J6UGC5_9ZZZZ
MEPTPAATMPRAPTTQIDNTSERLSAGLNVNRTPTSKINVDSTIKITAPALLSMANMMRENEKIMTPRPTAARTGNSIGFIRRLRNVALYALSLEARSLHDCTAHSTNVARRKMIPNNATMGVVIVPTSNNAAPAAPTSGHIDAVGCSDKTDESPSSVSPSRVNTTIVAKKAVAATRPNRAVAPRAEGWISNI